MNDKDFGPARPTNSSENPDAARGREQQRIEGDGGARSQGGTSANQNNSIAKNNPKRAQYFRAADLEASEKSASAAGKDAADKDRIRTRD